MTAEQFAADAKALYEQKKVIERKEIALKQAYIDSLPINVGDCIRIKRHNRIVEKAWVTRIYVDSWRPNDVELWYCKPKKDGTKSNREEHDIYIPLSDITIINDTL